MFCVGFEECLGRWYSILQVSMWYLYSILSSGIVVILSRTVSHHMPALINAGLAGSLKRKATYFRLRRTDAARFLTVVHSPSPDQAVSRWTLRRCFRRSYTSTITSLTG
jgi:hypothetical protein